MALDNWLLYLAAVTLLSLTPGPNGLLALSHGARYGARHSCSTILGGTVGFILLMLLSLMGLGSLLLASESAFATLKLLGAGYLIYLGIRQWRAAPLQLTATAENTTGPSKRRRAAEGFSVAISNPKVILFFMAFLPQFIDTQQPLLGQFLILASTFALVEFAVELLLAMSAVKILSWFNHRRGMQLFNRLTGGLFIGAGTWLAIGQH
ncbi:MAG: LysE family translocator [Halopseudomonas sp.]